MTAISAAWRGQLAEQARQWLKTGFSPVLRIDLFTPQWGYVLRSVLAAALALGIGFVS